MGPKKKPNGTELLLGQVIGELDGLKESVHTEFKAFKGTISALNGSLAHVKEKLNGLPCNERGKQLANILGSINKEEAEEATKQKEKRVGRRDLKVALVASLITGAFTVAGVVIAIIMTGA